MKNNNKNGMETKSTVLGLTKFQFEILTPLWLFSEGLTVARIREELNSATGRNLARSTIQTMIDRLYKRGWVDFVKVKGIKMFRPARSKEEALRKMTIEFVESAFCGNASKLVLSLVEQNILSKSEENQLQKVLGDIQE